MRNEELLAGYLKDNGAPCPSCGYDLRGTPTSTCPECGEELALAACVVKRDDRLKYTLDPRASAVHTFALLGVLIPTVLIGIFAMGMAVSSFENAAAVMQCVVASCLFLLHMAAAILLGVNLPWVMNLKRWKKVVLLCASYYWAIMVLPVGLLAMVL